MIASGILRLYLTLRPIVNLLMESFRSITTESAMNSLEIALCSFVIPGNPSNSISVIKEMYTFRPSSNEATVLSPLNRYSAMFVSMTRLLPFISQGLLYLQGRHLQLEYTAILEGIELFGYHQVSKNLLNGGFIG